MGFPKGAVLPDGGICHQKTIIWWYQAFILTIWRLILCLHCQFSSLFLCNFHVLRLDYKKNGGESFNLAVLHSWYGGEAWNSTGSSAKEAWRQANIVKWYWKNFRNYYTVVCWLYIMQKGGDNRNTQYISLLKCLFTLKTIVNVIDPWSYNFFSKLEEKLND